MITAGVAWGGEQDWDLHTCKRQAALSNLPMVLWSAMICGQGGFDKPISFFSFFYKGALRRNLVMARSEKLKTNWAWNKGITTKQKAQRVSVAWGKLQLMDKVTDKASPHFHFNLCRLIVINIIRVSRPLVRLLQPSTEAEALCPLSPPREFIIELVCPLVQDASDGGRDTVCLQGLGQ